MNDHHHAKPERLLRVTSPRFCAGAVWVKRGDAWVCTESAPILSWMRRKSPEEARAILERYGWAWEWVRPVGHNDPP